MPRRFAIDIDEPFELCGGNAFANPQEYLLTALSACMMVGYAALCALQGITLEKLEITSAGDIDLRGFFGLDPSVAAGYRELKSQVMIKGDGTEEQFQKIHQMALATSPNFYDITRAVRVMPELVIKQLGSREVTQQRIYLGGSGHQPPRCCVKELARARLRRPSA